MTHRSASGLSDNFATWRRRISETASRLVKRRESTTDWIELATAGSEQDLERILGRLGKRGRRTALQRLTKLLGTTLEDAERSLIRLMVKFYFWMRLV